MRAARPHPMLITLIYLLLTSGLSLFIGMIVSDPLTETMDLTLQGLAPAQAIPIVLAKIGSVGLFLHILVTAFGLVMNFGYSRWSLNAARGNSACVSDLVSGFSMAGRVLLLNILLAAYELVCSLVLSMAAQLVLHLVFWVPGLNILALWGVLFGVFIGHTFLLLPYQLAAYCMLDDPELGAFHAMGRSRQLMKGHAADLFFLRLSFFGWYLLACAVIAAAFLSIVLPAGAVMAIAEMSISTLGVGIAAAAVLMLALLPLSLWLTPYITITECKFYDRLRTAQSSEPPFGL